MKRPIQGGTQILGRGEIDDPGAFSQAIFSGEGQR